MGVNNRCEEVCFPEPRKKNGAPLINWDDAMDGLRMGLSPFNGTKLGKHGPNILDYDYLTLTRK